MCLASVLDFALSFSPIPSVYVCQYKLLQQTFPEVGFAVTAFRYGLWVELMWLENFHKVQVRFETFLNDWIFPLTELRYFFKTLQNYPCFIRVALLFSVEGGI